MFQLGTKEGPWVLIIMLISCCGSRSPCGGNSTVPSAHKNAPMSAQHMTYTYASQALLMYTQRMRCCVTIHAGVIAAAGVR